MAGLTMDRWDAPSSIFAPVVMALPPDTEWAGFGNAALIVERRIPTSTRRMRVKNTGFSRGNIELWTRRVTHLSEPDPFSQALILTEDRESGATIDIYWKLGLTLLKDGLLEPAVPADYKSAIMSTYHFQMLGEGIVGAPQLALVRHLIAEEVKAASPDAIVFGGQHGWHNDWWTEEVSEEGA